MDDDPDYAEVLSSQLRRIGFRAKYLNTSTLSVADALAVAHAAGATKLLVDCHWRGGGQDFTGINFLRAWKGNASAILMSTRTVPGFTGKFFRKGSSQAELRAVLA